MGFNLVGTTTDMNGIYSIHKKFMFEDDIDVVIELPRFYEKKMCLIRLDKYEQFVVMKMLGITTPDTKKVMNTFTEFYDMIFNYDTDVVLKPLMGAKSMGVYILSLSEVQDIANGGDCKEYESLWMRIGANKNNPTEERDQNYDLKTLCFTRDRAIVQPKLDLIAEDRIILGITGSTIVSQSRAYFRESSKVSDLTASEIFTWSKEVQDILYKFREFMVEYKIPIISIDIGYTETGVYVLEFSGQYGYSKGLTADAYTTLKCMTDESIETVCEIISKIP